jgi:hypothetical protein
MFAEPHFLDSSNPVCPSYGALSVRIDPEPPTRAKAEPLTKPKKPTLPTNTPMQLTKKLIEAYSLATLVRQLAEHNGCPVKSIDLWRLLPASDRNMGSGAEPHR